MCRHCLCACLHFPASFFAGVSPEPSFLPGAPTQAVILQFFTMSSGASSSNATFTTVPLIPCEKLTGSATYSSWSAAVQLWFEGQGHEDHLTKQASEIPEADRPRWKQIDASLCAVLWFSIDAKLQPQYQAFRTCYEVWTKAK
jgi:hypothetical protein